MKNKKGQALVEFIILLPIIIFIMLGLIDLFLVFSNKNNLESKMYDVVELYRKNDELRIKDYLSVDKKNIKYTIKTGAKYTKITLNEEYKFITPGLSKILGNPYKIQVERIILKNGEQ